MNTQRKKAAAFSAASAAVSIAAYAMLFSLSRLLVAIDSFAGSAGGALSKTSFFFFIVFSYLIFVVISRLFVRYNTTARECWLADHRESMTRIQILAGMFRTPEFLAGLAVTFIIGLIPWAPKNAITDFVHYGESVNHSAYRIAEFFEYVPFYLVFYILQSVSARKDWMKKRADFRSGKEGMKTDLRQFLKFFFLYSAILLISAVLLSNGLFIFAIILLVILFAAALVTFALSAFPALFRLIRGCFQERRFISGIESLCTERGWTSKVAKGIFLRLIRHSAGQTVSVSANGKTIPVKVVCIPDGLASVLFGDSGKYLVTHRIGITQKITFFSFVSEYRYDFEPGAEPGTVPGRFRHLVLIPSHPSVWLSDRGSRTGADNGSIIGDYRLWSSSAFLRALERGVEDKI